MASLPSVPVIHLDPVHPLRVSERYSGADHPMREVTRAVAFEGAWDTARSRDVRGIFDGLAPDWTETRYSPERLLPLIDALDRGGVDGRTVIELGAGTCLMSAELCSRFDRVVAVDLSLEMLRNAVTADAPLVNADAALLPFPAGTADVLVLMNMLLFPTEVDRCLARHGALVWVSSRAEDTPIHLSAGDVVTALAAAGAGDWGGTASRAGEGSWCVLRRSRTDNETGRQAGNG